jgi:large subunit ribosomal protein L3
MPKPHNPRRGSMQFWPRKRSKHSVARVRSWAYENQAKPLGFIGYKAGMTHVIATDNRSKALTKGDKINMASTILDCPPMVIVGAAFYKKSIFGLYKSTSLFSIKLPKELSKTIQLPKKQAKNLDDVKEFEDVRLIVCSQPKLADIGTKKPKMMEIAMGGSNEEKVAYIKENLGKEIIISDVFDKGTYVDAHGITKGKGFQGTVKRYGVPIMQHKAEKKKRGIGNLGAWTPKRVDYRVAQPGKMGFHSRTEYNKQIIKFGEEGKEVTTKGGLRRYGIVRNNYLLIRGSLLGSKRRPVLLTKSIRVNPKRVKEAPEISYVSLRN